MIILKQTFQIISSGQDLHCLRSMRVQLKETLPGGCQGSNGHLNLGLVTMLRLFRTATNESAEKNWESSKLTLKTL